MTLNTERILSLLNKHSFEKNVFHILDTSGISSKIILLDNNFIQEDDVTLGEFEMELNGFGTVFPINLWNKIHVGYIFYLPTKLTHVQRNMIRVHSDRKIRLVFDKHVRIMFFDDLISIVMSTKNNLITIVPNLPTSIPGVVQ